MLNKMFFAIRCVFTLVANIHYLMERQKTLIVFTQKASCVCMCFIVYINVEKKPLTTSTNLTEQH